MGRKLEAKVGLDEQESDIRLFVRGKAAMYAISPILSSGRPGSKSGEARQKAMRFTPGGLSRCPFYGLPMYKAISQGIGKSRQKSAEAVVVCFLYR